jgi:hypothetical protein
MAQLADPESLQDVIDLLQSRRDVNDRIRKNREYGLRVQAIVQSILEKRGKDVKVVDLGYDLRVCEVSDWGGFRAGPFLVEVKGTRSDEVRMTPLQAETAAQNERYYILCVVDLRSQVDAEPTHRTVQDAIRMVVDVGTRLRPIVQDVGSAIQGAAGIRVDQTGQLRYCVQASVWQGGLSLDDWLGSAF